VPVESQVGIEFRHADVEERFAELVVGVGSAKTDLVPDSVRQFDHENRPVVPTITFAAYG